MTMAIAATGLGAIAIGVATWLVAPKNRWSLIGPIMAVIALALHAANDNQAAKQRSQAAEYIRAAQLQAMSE